MGLEGIFLSFRAGLRFFRVFGCGFDCEVGIQVYGSIFYLNILSYNIYK